jgi:acetyl-CoA C-acetyltransferase
MSHNNVVIVSAKRTPVGSFLGQLSQLSAPTLGSKALAAAMESLGLQGGEIDECIMGQVLSAGSGQAPARQALLAAGLPSSIPCMTINKVCGSGLKAIMMASDNIALGHTEISLAGGQESMSQAPFLLENVRNGYRMGNQGLADSMLKDGLWDPYHNWHMGNSAEFCVREYKMTREEQDAFAVSSYKKAQKAQQDSYFKKEITPLQIKDRKGLIEINQDEEPSKVMWDKISTLKPAFEKDGSITAANASKINDGAAALVLMKESVALKKGLKPLARVVAHGSFAQDPKWFTTAPVGAIKKSLERASLKVTDIDLWEINEAFATVTLAAMKELSIPGEKVNIHGGAVAIGHPIGASGARILTTLVHALHTHNQKRGLATLCIGGGEAVSLIVERI